MFEIGYLEIFIGLFTGLVSASNNTKCVSLSNNKCEIQPTFINLHPNEYCQEIHYYPFTSKLDKCVKTCSALNDLSSYKVCVSNKTEDFNLSMFNMITGINESKTLTKLISCKCKCNLMVENVSQINGGITINADVSIKNIVYGKKIIFGILAHVFVKMENI